MAREAVSGPGAPPLRDCASLCLQGESGEPGPKGQVSSAPVTPPSFSPTVPLGCGGTATLQAPSPFYTCSHRVRPFTRLCTHPALAARSPRRTRLPRPQRGCGSSRSAGLPRAPWPSRTGWRSWRARTNRETGRGGESAPQGGGLLNRKSLGVLLMPPKVGNSQRKLASLRLAPRSRSERMGVGCSRRDFGQMLKIFTVKK